MGLKANKKKKYEKIVIFILHIINVLSIMHAVCSTTKDNSIPRSRGSEDGS